MPTMAILLAPPVVAGNAWFAINGHQADGVALGLAGYAVLMATTQLGLIPAYRTVPFGAGWWSFSFPYAAAAGNAIIWLAVEHTPHQRRLDLRAARARSPPSSATSRSARPSRWPGTSSYPVPNQRGE